MMTTRRIETPLEQQPKQIMITIRKTVTAFLNFPDMKILVLSLITITLPVRFQILERPR